MGNVRPAGADNYPLPWGCHPPNELAKLLDTDLAKAKASKRLQ